MPRGLRASGRSPADACSLTFAPPRAAVQDEEPEGYRQLDDDGVMPPAAQLPGCGELLLVEMGAVRVLPRRVLAVPGELPGLSAVGYGSASLSAPARQVAVRPS